MMQEVHLMSLSLRWWQQCNNTSDCQMDGECSSVTNALIDLPLIKICVLYRYHLLVYKWKFVRADHVKLKKCDTHVENLSAFGELVAVVA